MKQTSTPLGRWFLEARTCSPQEKSSPTMLEAMSVFLAFMMLSSSWRTRTTGRVPGLCVSHIGMGSRTRTTTLWKTKRTVELLLCSTRKALWIGTTPQMRSSIQSLCIGPPTSPQRRDGHRRDDMSTTDILLLIEEGMSVEEAVHYLLKEQSKRKGYSNL